MSKTQFSKLIKCIRPLQKSQESIAQFTRRVIEIYTPYSENGFPEIEWSDSTIKKYAYGSSNISTNFALELLQYKDEQSLADFIDEADDAISSTIHDLLKSEFSIKELTLHNVGENLAKLFTKVLTDAATKSNKKSPQPVNVEDFINKVKIENEMLVLGNAKIKLPTAKLPSQDISEEELKLNYLYALMDAYNDAEKTNIQISNRFQLKKKYRENFQEQRINFYEAESLKNFTRDSITSSSDEFQKLLDETYDGVINTCRRNYLNGYDRLLSVLEQAATIEPRSSVLYHIPGMVSIKRKYGFCHMLVNDSRFNWIEEEEDE